MKTLQSSFDSGELAPGPFATPREIGPPPQPRARRPTEARRDNGELHSLPLTLHRRFSPRGARPVVLKAHLPISLLISAWLIGRRLININKDKWSHLQLRMEKKVTYACSQSRVMDG